jgi:hypothetical protein
MKYSSTSLDSSRAAVTSTVTLYLKSLDLLHAVALELSDGVILI